MILEDKIRLCTTCRNAKHLLNMLSVEDRKTALDIMIIDNADKYAIENNVVYLDSDKYKIKKYSRKYQAELLYDKLKKVL